LVLLEGFKELTACDILSGFYFINEHGEIVSKKCNKKLRFKTDKDGYCAVNLCTNELIGAKEHKRKTFRVAGLVLREFGDEPPATMKDPTVEHKDGNKKNNHISNLCWLERNENSKTRKHTCPGEKNGAAKLTEQQVIEIKKLLSYQILTLREIGELYGVDKSTISKIKRSKNWSSIGSTGRI
jgi:hypothetical protein